MGLNRTEVKLICAWLRDTFTLLLNIFACLMFSTSWKPGTCTWVGTLEGLANDLN